MEGITKRLRASQGQGGPQGPLHTRDQVNAALMRSLESKGWKLNHNPSIPGARLDQCTILLPTGRGRKAKSWINKRGQLHYHVDIMCVHVGDRPPPGGKLRAITNACALLREELTEYGFEVLWTSADEELEERECWDGCVMSIGPAVIPSLEVLCARVVSRAIGPEEAAEVLPEEVLESLTCRAWVKHPEDSWSKELRGVLRREDTPRQRLGKSRPPSHHL